MKGHPTQPGECAGHAGPRVLWTSGALQEVYQGVCQYSAPLVQHVRERGEDGSGGSAPQKPGGHGCPEGKGPIHTCPGVP